MNIESESKAYLPKICVCSGRVAALIAVFLLVNSFGDDSPPSLQAMEKACTSVEGRKEVWRGARSILESGDKNTFAARAAACLVLRNCEHASRWATLIKEEDAKKEIESVVSSIKSDSDAKIEGLLESFRKVDLSTEASISVEVTKLFSNRTGVAVGLDARSSASDLIFYVPVRLMARDHKEAAAVWYDLAMCLDVFEGIVPIRIVFSTSETDPVDPLVVLRKHNVSQVAFPRINFRRSRSRDVLESLWFRVWSTLP